MKHTRAKDCGKCRHRGLEAFGFHTSRNPDGGFTYKPLTRGVGPFYSIGVGSFYVVKARRESRAAWSLARPWLLYPVRFRFL